MGKRDTPPVEMKGEIVGESALAILFLHEDAASRKASVWLPRSAIQIDEHDDESGEATIQVEEWLAMEKGLI